MSGDRTAEVAFACLLLVLPLSALIARGVPIGRAVKMAAAWIAIFVVGLLILSQRDRFGAITGFLTDQHIDGSATRIAMGEYGHFHAEVVVNGVKRTMLVDSGATTTALSEATAKAAGIALDKRRFPVMLDTANGSATAQAATAKTVTVGSIPMNDLAVVVSPAFSDADAIRINLLVPAGFVAGRGTHARPRTGEAVNFT